MARDRRETPALSIDITSETPITFGEAASLLPRRRRGRRVATQTLYRWARNGIQGVTLETLDTPSGLVTSRAAVQRFLERLSEARQATPGPPAPVPVLSRRSASQRLRADAKAASELASMGVK
jgi:hypothetical protein